MMLLLRPLRLACCDGDNKSKLFPPRRSRAI